MDPISLILAALLTGVAAGVSTSATNAVHDAYLGLREALKRRLAGKPAALDAVEHYVEDPEAWRGNLEVQLGRAGADKDQAILDAAFSLMQLADPAGAGAGKYSVSLIGASGVQVGDGNTQTNYFGSASS
jgi:opacity protein-like surface antigen